MAWRSPEGRAWARLHGAIEASDRRYPYLCLCIDGFYDRIGEGGVDLRIAAPPYDLRPAVQMRLLAHPWDDPGSMPFAWRSVTGPDARQCRLLACLFFAHEAEDEYRGR